MIGLISILSLFYFMDRGGIEKYAIAAAMSAFFLFLGRKSTWNFRAFLIVFIPLSVYLIVGGVSGMFRGTYQFSTVKNILYMLLPFFVSFSMFVCYGVDAERVVDWQLIACIITYFLPNALYIYLWFAWESTFAFSFGAFSIYYAYKKRWIFFGISLILMYVCDKRIALLGVVLALFVMMAVWFFQNNKKFVCAIWATITALIYGYLYLIYSGKLEAICWGLNINTNGRVQMYTRMANQYNFLSHFWGNGIGIIENLLEYLKIETYANLHNDLLKFYIELGFLGLLLYLVSYYFVLDQINKYFGDRQMRCVLGMLVYSMVLYATDNVSIYLMYLIPFYSVLFAVLSPEKNSYDIERRNLNAKQTS